MNKEEEKATLEEKPVIKEPKMYLRFDCTNESLQKEVIDVLESFVGTTKVTIRCSKTGNLYQISTMVNPCNALLYEIYGLIGSDNVVVK